MKNIPIWLIKLLLVVGGLFYWGVPQWIVNDIPNHLGGKNEYITYKNSLGEIRSVPVWCMLEDSLRTDIKAVEKKYQIITLEIYYEVMTRNKLRSQRYNMGEPIIEISALQFKVDSLIKLGIVTQQEIDRASSHYKDVTNPRWREDEAKNKKEFGEFFKNIPNLLLKIYWSNIIFAFLWFMLTYVSRKRDGEDRYIKIVVAFNPLSIFISAIIWPYFFFRSIIRGWLETQVEITIRATKVNPFSLLSKDEKMLAKKFASSVKIERVEILESFRAGRKHSISFALCATLFVRIMPVYGMCVPLVETVHMEHSMQVQNESHPVAIDHDVGWNKEIPSIEYKPWKIFLPEQEKLLFIFSLKKCLDGVPKKVEHVPLRLRYFNSKN
jgi:hypothetical protein